MKSEKTILANQKEILRKSQQKHVRYELDDSSALISDNDSEYEQQLDQDSKTWQTYAEMQNSSQFVITIQPDTLELVKKNDNDADTEEDSDEVEMRQLI